MAVENSFFSSQEKNTFESILKLKTVILNCNNISQYYYFTMLIVSNKYRLGEQKRLPSNPKPLNCCRGLFIPILV